MLQIYFRLCKCKIYQNRLRFAIVIDKSSLPRFLCRAVYCYNSCFISYAAWLILCCGWLCCWIIPVKLRAVIVCWNRRGLCASWSDVIRGEVITAKLVLYCLSVISLSIFTLYIDALFWQLNGSYSQLHHSTGDWQALNSSRNSDEDDDDDDDDSIVKYRLNVSHAVLPAWGRILLTFKILVVFRP